MLSIQIEKTPDGFIIRESGYVAAISTVGCLLAAFTCAIGVALSGGMDSVRERIGCMVIVALFAVVSVSVGFDAVTHFGRRLVMDSGGCRLQGTFLKERSIPWDAVRDFGVTHKTVRTRGGYAGHFRGHTHHIYTLYVSPTRLSSTSDGRVVQRSNRAVILQIRGADVDDLLSREVLDFCEKQVNRGREESERVVLYLATSRQSED